MKKLLALLLLIPGLVHAACDTNPTYTYTTNAGITKPPLNACGWGTTTNSNWDIVDSSFGILGATQTWTSTNTFSNPLILNNPLRLYDSTGNHYLQINASQTVTTTNLVLPVDDGTPNQILQTDGIGNLSWTAQAGAGAASTLNVSQSSVTVTSPTVTINFLGPPFSLVAVNTSTAEVNLDVSSVTLRGNAFNNANQLVLLDSSARLPPLDGSQLTSVAGVILTSTNVWSGGNTYQSSSTLNGRVYISSTVFFTGSAGNSGQYLISAGTAGVPSWTSVTSSLHALDDTSNTCIGYQACNVMGSSSGGNVAHGVQALLVASTATQNTVIGYQAGFNITTSTDNTLVGYRAGTGITTGRRNTLIGGTSGNTLTTGEYNTILGWGSEYITTGSGNIVIGANTPENGLTTGSSNTVIGTNLGGSATMSANDSNVTLLGQGAKSVNGGGLVNATAIGAQASVTVSSTIQLGNAGINVVASTFSATNVLVSSNTVLKGATFYFGGPIILSTNIVFSPNTAGIVASTSADTACQSCVGWATATANTSIFFAGNGTYSEVSTITLVAGEWSIDVVAWVQNNGATWTGFNIGISSTSGNSSTGLINGDNLAGHLFASSASTPLQDTVSITGWRFLNSGTTSLYLKHVATWSLGGPPQVVGARISARRVH